MSYEVLKNRMSNGTVFLRQMAEERINALADNLEITQQQAEELLLLAEQNGVDVLPQNIGERLKNVEDQTTANTEAIDLLISGATA